MGSDLFVAWARFLRFIFSIVCKLVLSSFLIFISSKLFYLTTRAMNDYFEFRKRRLFLMLMSLESDRLGGTLGPCLWSWVSLSHSQTLVFLPIDWHHSQFHWIVVGCRKNELYIIVTVITIYYHQNVTHWGDNSMAYHVFHIYLETKIQFKKMHVHGLLICTAASVSMVPSIRL